MFNVDKISSYIQNITSKSSNKEYLQKKLASIEVFSTWMKKKGIINQAELVSINSKISNYKTQAGHNISKDSESQISGSEKPQTESSKILDWKGNTGKILLAIGSFSLGAVMLSQVTQSNKSVLTQFSNNSNGRVISYKGHLSDNQGNPVNYKTDVVFKLYPSKDAADPVYAGGCLGKNAIEPDYNGSFSIVIGHDCRMKKIPEEVFNGSELFLGISIGGDKELTPRQPIPKVGYAISSDKLKGITLGTKTNAIPYIDENGVLLIEASSPRIQSDSGEFSIVGESVTLATKKGAGGSLYFTPDKDTVITTGNLAVGKYNPTVKLDVAGDASLEGNLSFGGYGAYINLLNDNDLIFQSSKPGSSDFIPRVTLSHKGNLGIGTVSPNYSLSVVQNVPNSGVSSFTNLSAADDKSTSVLKLSLGASDSATQSNFIQFYNKSTSETNGTQIGSVRVNNGHVSYETSGADFAEYFPAEDTSQAGDIVSISTNGVRKSKEKEQVLGVISEQAGFIGNTNKGGNGVVVGLIGQIKTNIATFTGDIRPGDSITGSKIPGYGTKTTESGNIVGTALTDSITGFSNSNCPDMYRSQKDITGNSIRCGQLVVMVRPVWHESSISLSSPQEIAMITQNSSINDTSELDNNGLATLLKGQLYMAAVGSKVLDTVLQSAKVIAANAQFGLTETRDLIVTGTLSAENYVGNSIKAVILRASSVSAINGSINQLTSEKIVSPVIKSEKIETNDLTASSIKPKSNILEIDLSNENNSTDDGQFAEVAIKGLTDKIVTRLDNSGNATFSGVVEADSLKSQIARIEKLTSDNIESSQASISGQLYAREVKSENISSLEASVSNIKSSVTSNNTELSSLRATIEEQLKKIAATSLPNANFYQQIDEKSLNTASKESTLVSNQPSIFEKIDVTNDANLYNLTIANNITNGQILIKNNQLSSLGWELNITSLLTVTFFDQAVSISKDGSLTTSGVITAKGGVKSNRVESIDSSLQFKLGSQNKDTNKFSYINADNQEVASIDSKGEAHFAKLNLDSHQASGTASIISPQENFQKNRVFASAIDSGLNSAGLATLPAGENEIVIYNNTLSKDSLIYLTPVGILPSGIIGVVEKITCEADAVGCKPYFKVGIEKAEGKQLQFNWLVLD